MPATARQMAVALLEHEVVYLSGLPAPPVLPRTVADLDARLARKQWLLRQLVAEIEQELRLPPATGGAAEQPWHRFASSVAERVEADVALFFQALPWAHTLRSAALDRAGGEPAVPVSRRPPPRVPS